MLHTRRAGEGMGWSTKLCHMRAWHPQATPVEAGLGWFRSFCFRTLYFRLRPIFIPTEALLALWCEASARLVCFSTSALRVLRRRRLNVETRRVAELVFLVQCMPFCQAYVTRAFFVWLLQLKSGLGGGLSRGRYFLKNMRS